MCAKETNTGWIDGNDGAGLAVALRTGGRHFVGDLPGASAAALALAALRTGRRTTICLTDGPKTLDVFWRDLHTLAAEAGVKTDDLCYFPSRETVGHGPTPADLTGDRLATLRRLAAGKRPALVATCIQAVLQRTLPRDLIEESSLTFAAGQDIEPDKTLLALTGMGYDIQVEVQRKGQAALRGGVMDVWPIAAPWPHRLDLFGNTIESIRTFDPISQRSIERVETFVATPADEKAEQLSGTFADFIAGPATWLWAEYESIEEHADLFAEVVREANAGNAAIGLDELRGTIGSDAAQLLSGLTPPDGAKRLMLDLAPVDGLPALDAKAFLPDLIERHRDEMTDRLLRRIEDGWRLHFFFATEGSRDRFLESHGRKFEAQRKAGLAVIHTGPLSEGFCVTGAKRMVLGESDLFGRKKESRGRYELHGEADRSGARSRVRQLTERIADWTDIQPGDFVVHADHGIGKYQGLYEIDFNGVKQEALTIEYAGGGKLYLPVAQAHLLGRYVGVGKAKPELHTLGGKRWDRDKEAAQKAVEDLAGLLLETQAARDALEGHAYPPDVPWQHEFEAAFPYEETPDQQRAIDDVKHDMESRRPMDRLVCGDVGYGKTEVAMRAAFKAVMGGKQVALLVPTTILAQQHGDTFRTRMAS